MQTATHKLSDGARRLAAICSRGTITAVAAKIGSSEGAIRHFVHGRRSPSRALRTRLAESYGIEIGAWKARATTPKPSAATDSKQDASARAPAAHSPNGVAIGPSLATAGISNREKIATIVARIEAAIAACGPDVPRNHVASLYAQLQAAVSRLSRLDGDEELTAAALLRSRAWREVEHVLLAVLRRHAGAAEDLVGALDTLKKAKGEPHGAMGR